MDRSMTKKERQREQADAEQQQVKRAQALLEQRLRDVEADLFQQTTRSGTEAKQQEIESIRAEVSRGTDAHPPPEHRFTDRSAN